MSAAIKSAEPTNPFLSLQPRRSGRSSLLFRAWFIALISCLIAGAVLATWRAKNRTANVREVARAEAAVRARYLEEHFNQALVAANLLSVVARQNGGLVPNFDLVASDILKTVPGLDFVTLEPGGVVGEVSPRS